MNTRSMRDVGILKGRYLLAGLVGLIVFGLFETTEIDRLSGYFMLLAAIALPLFLWLQADAPGIPIFPAVAVMHFLFYALPLLRYDLAFASLQDADIMLAAETVCVYLISGAIAYRLMLFRVKTPKSALNEVSMNSGLKQLMYLGFSAAIFYFLGVWIGYLDFVGSSIGVIRAVGITAGMLSCFIFGHLRALNRISGPHRYAAFFCVTLMVALTISTLFLIGGLMFCFAAIAGYTLTVWKVPFRVIALVLAIFFVFHAGKAEVRAKYWGDIDSRGLGISLTQVPQVLVEWFGDGIQQIVAGQDKVTIIDRASLLNLLLRVQIITPDHVPYMEGESYSYLPGMLVPRFLESDRTASNKAQEVLNVTFGIQTEEAAMSTAIGWGLIAEGYANFGIFGVIGVGIIIGLFSGFLTRWSNGAPVLSIRMLVSVIGFLMLINLEADLSNLIVNTWQAMAAAVLFFTGFKAVTKQGARRTVRLPASSG